MIVSVNEPLIEKTKSFKANSTVNYLLTDGKLKQVKGKIILYFMKDPTGRYLIHYHRVLIMVHRSFLKNPYRK